MLREMLDKYNLFELQNHPVNQDQDHLTICGFFQEEEQFKLHAEKLYRRIQEENDLMESYLGAQPFEERDYYGY
jgi:hypothetical protein